MRNRFLAAAAVLASLAAMSIPAAAAAAQSPVGPASAGAAKGCAKFSGTVNLTDTNPDTVILHVIQGKVNAATTFTMTPSTVYVRNGQPASFGAIKIGDTGYITATEQLPSGALLACSVVVTGP
jgi:hypothetical protein